MNINTDGCNKTPCLRESFNLISNNTHGIVLHIHHTTPIGYNSAKQRIRFLHASFNSTGMSLAASNHLGNIYIFDFAINKYWLLVHVNCSVIKFVTSCNPSASEVLFVGTTTGDVRVYNSHNSKHLSNLLGHKNPVTDISFSDNEECTTLANNEAILWNLKSYTKLQVLHLEEGAILKFVMFIPVSNNVIACFNDETVQIWEANTYEPIKQIEKTVGGSFNKLSIRSIAFTSNGQLMAVVGHSPTIFVFNVETLHLMKEFSFSDMHVTIKKAQFLPNLFDDGVNKILSFLTSSGTLFFYDMQLEMFISKINVEDEVWKYAVDPSSKRIATISKCGVVEIHSLGHVLMKQDRGRVPRALPLKTNHKTKRKASKKQSNEVLRKQLSEVLDTTKLNAILKEYGEYPNLYRKIIWRHLLGLPNDEAQYAVISCSHHELAFSEFEKHYPLDIKQDMKNLKRFTENLVSWCPFLSVVNYLPVLIFPFVKFLQSEPVMCFETLMSLVVNYCQYWFEYHPVPPLNILGLVESIIIQQDAELMEIYNKKGVTSKTYAWFILQSMFSEVLSSGNWLIFCDHLITNHAVFLIVAVAAYSLVNKTILMTMDNIDDFEFFFRTNSTIDFKRFISRCYKLLNDERMENHPRLYIKGLVPFENGKYLVFDQFPKNCLEVCRSINHLRTEVNCLKREEQFMDTNMAGLKKLKELERNNEEYIRHVQLNKLYCNKLEQEQHNVCIERKRLESLRKLNVGSQNFVNGNFRTQDAFQNTCSGVFTGVEEDLLKHYTNLLKHKIQIEGLIDEDVPLDFIQLKRSYKEISDEINKTQTRMSIPSKEYLKQLNVATGLAAVNSLIEKVESKIAGKSSTLDKTKSKYVVKKLASESEELSHEINKLMSLLAETK